jgi:hypothetical protein
MSDDSSTIRSPRVSARGTATVTDLATRRRSDDVLRSITLVFGGVNYGTLSITAPYTRGQPVALYLLPQAENADGEVLAGALDCLVTDDFALSDAPETITGIHTC